ncbi:Molybdopterin biosynthesis MoaE [Saccharata proteae CBS 121410]|uniref:Molybdopterin synthase catalytic subunit n=1 Tax=Saccharata proteae CBS 121410 TaxID=1314787 RepID=A0A9P4HZI2_9PEZI|nr:Molybdopterin biosynthesis MoaE [Saccharata proteae CBS 121410]
MASRSSDPMIREEENLHVELTYEHLDVVKCMARVKSPKAGAVVIFAGTTRDNFADKTVKSLTYQSYAPRALKTLLELAQSIKEKHALTAISLTHRLGTVPIGEESILIAVSAPHRQAAWRGGEEALEVCKEKVEVWKLEEFEDEEGVWRANRDGQMGVKVAKTKGRDSNGVP